MDIKKIFFGFTNLVRCAYSQERLSVNLAYFSASSPSAHKNSTNSYDVVLANSTNSGVWVTLLFDLYLKENPTHPKGHYAYFGKKIFVKRRESQKVGIRYNWDSDLTFDIDGIILKPDTFWQGPCQTNGYYFVKAVLLNPKGVPYDQLNIIQDVSL